MKIIYIYALVTIVSLNFIGCQVKSNKGDTSPSYLKEISNEGKNKKKPYLTAGDKACIIGTQDGLFPDMGGHVADEMGGIWTHPIKLADGFWARIGENSVPDGVWLIEADEYITYPFGSEFIYKDKLEDLEVNRFQFAPDQEKGVIINYTIKNNSAKARNITLDFALKTDISPVWFSKENGILDYSDQLVWDSNNKLFSARDSVHDWSVVWGTDSPIISYDENFNAPIDTKGLGKSGLIQTSVEIASGKEKNISFIISGSQNSLADAISSNRLLLKNKEKMLSEKQTSFNNLLNVSKITIPDKNLESTYNWVKVNTRWLEMDLDGFGRFLGAGAIEYPWLFGCDNSYALQGVLASGNFDLAKSTLTILKNVSEKVNGNGRIIHEMSSNGYVYNKGNTQETAHFIVAVWKTFLWTGDIAFLQDMYPYIKKGIHWLTVDMDANKNLFPEGYGIMEVHGLNAELIDVSVYTQQALEVTSKMATLFKEEALASEYAKQAVILKDKINTEFWDEDESTYCDFFGTKEQAISVAKGAIKQIGIGGYVSGDHEKNILFYEDLIKKFNNYPDYTQKGWQTNKNWVITTPIETAIAPYDKAILSLDKIRAEHCGEYGPYLSAVERDRMMTISTGVQAVCEAQYGRIEECLWYTNKIVSTLNRTLPGSINEMMPDYGCPVQAWTIYGVAVPLINYIFGITPDAYNKEVIIEPNLPSEWSEAMLENQPVGTNHYTVKSIKKDNTKHYTILSKEKGWKTILKIKDLAGKKYMLNGNSMVAISDDILLDGLNNTVVINL
ncbi:amylo-alpha-1,6-glucosidase [Dysgonomonas sp. Marseille-P4677]|uniref:alpha-L-rhamnosidase-related protein n=1 Tax=Dysgonomonas sp. Marseille-P4677 TaxID=2364790 RepID=UPI0019129A64|nr:amylo-alpha-1,6-glucosidase [Dysgonomonas sp. Marseille-P4677]MBK5722978.1 amylo-alpha-1,6-glucosidase [Dysgonomonas sp. Marseille-P4677]